MSFRFKFSGWFGLVCLIIAAMALGLSGTNIHKFSSESITA